MFHFLYCTVNLINEMLYVGKHSTNDIDDCYLGSGKLLLRAIQKYGKENFVRHILSFYDSAEDAYEMESKLVDEQFVADKNTYNIASGGKHSSIASSLGGIAWRNKLHNDTQLYEEHCKEFTRRMIQCHANGPIKSRRFKGKSHKTSSKKAIGVANSIHQTGEGNSQFGSIWVYHLQLKSSKRVKTQEEFDQALGDGWLKGRKIKW